MSYVIICNTGSDSLNKINTDNLKNHSLVLKNGETPFGPHGLTLYKDKILVTNNYNNSISIVDNSTFKEEKNLYIGSHPNDIIADNNILYITCGELNSLIIYDLKNERINFDIPTGKFPHDICIYKEKNLIFISNMGEDSISVIDYIENKEIKRLKVQCTPIKIEISQNKKFLYLCMSYLGYDKKGCIGVIDLKSLELIYKIEVGLSPVDFYENNNYLYVSNLCDGSISIINLNEMKEEEQIITGGMPRGIIKIKDYIFVGDYLNGLLNIINIKDKKIKAISIGSEPNAMTLFETIN